MECWRDRSSVCANGGIAASTLEATRREMLKLALERLDLLETQMDKPARIAASALIEHRDAVKRLSSAPGLGTDSAQKIIAEIGPKVAT